MSNATRTEVKREKLVISRIHKSGFQKAGSKTIEVKQKLVKTSYYPSKKYNSDLGDSLFTEQEFGASEEKYTSEENRTAWIQMPDNIGDDKAIEMLNKFPNACIVKILSNTPILNSNQKLAINNGLKTLDDFADTQAVRYPKGHINEGQLILDSDGNVQYRVTVFHKEATEDEDRRGNGEVYVSAKLQAEHASAMFIDSSQEV